MRPGEIFPLRWQSVAFNGNKGLIKIAEGKSKAARRALPMVPEVRATLKACHRAQNRPKEGWVFPSKSSVGHFEPGSAKNQHAVALRNSKVAPF